jgi:hypothetical protein
MDVIAASARIIKSLDFVFIAIRLGTPQDYI